MRLAAPGYRLRSHYYAYGSNVRNCFRSLHTKDTADTLHPESRASRRQDGMKVSRFYCMGAFSATLVRMPAPELNHGEDAIAIWYLRGWQTDFRGSG